MIDILVPVLGRPHRAAPIVDSITNNTTVAHQIFFLCSPTETEQIRACYETGANVLTVEWAPGPADYAKKMNHGFRETDSEFVFLAADDLEFQPGWDSQALILARSLSVIATNDLANKQVMRGEFGTHCLVKRSYVTERGGSLDGPGVLLHEGYDHNFVDRELCGLARSRRQFGFARDSHVKHLHPLWRTAPHDATYEKALRHFHKDQRLYHQRAVKWGERQRPLTARERRLAKR